MSFARMLNQRLKIEHRSVTSQDSYGNDVYGTTSTSDLAGYVEQTESQEVTVDRETYVVDWLVVLAPETVIDASDRIILADKVLEVVGPPHRVWNPRRATVHHVEARAREVTG